MSSPSAVILFVDDDDANRRLFGQLFKGEGFLVWEAATGEEALRLAENRPDIVILDVNLPDLNGIEVCRRLKARPATASTPVLHVSAVYVNSGDRSEALEGGADGYLVKPVEPREILATVRSLLRVHAAEEAARTAAQQWRLTFDAISDPVCLLDPAGAVLRCNRAAADLLGRPFGDLLGRSYAGLLQEAFGLDGPPPLGFDGDEPGRQVNELRLGRRWFGVTADPIRDASGAAAGGVSILTDVTRHKALEEQLRQVQKLEAVGRLAGGVAHDFNNLLTAVVGNASLLLQMLDAETEQYALAAAIEQAAWRAAELTRRLLGFSRQTLLWLRPVNLNDSVAEVVGLLRRTIDPRIAIEVRAADSARVRADAGQINQVLMNLCLNACDAMPEGGRLLLEARDETLTDDQSRGRVEARAGAFVRLRVADTGHGITAENLPRIFDPFFTTKPPGKGTGLGLAMVFGIVKQHDGWVECRSEPGAGACFDVYLPQLEEGAGAAAPAVPPPDVVRPGHGEAVLLADDNEMLRALGAAMLGQNGYRALLAEDGQEAVEVFEREGGRVDLVILDLTMPRLSGREALERLRRLDPSVRVLFASGYSDEQLTEGDRAAIRGFIAKPYRERDLIRAVQDALQGPAA